MKKIKILIFSILLLSIFFIFIYLNKSSKKTISKVETTAIEDRSYSSNIIENVKYTSRDAKGNEYTITALKGEIDIKDNNIIFLQSVKAIIKLKNSNEILILSDFGKYNINNFDTIFSKNVIINYLHNKIKGEYLDFSIIRNSMIISQNVVYTDNSNILKTDVIEIDIDTKDTKFFMYDNNDKVSLKKMR